MNSPILVLSKTIKLKFKKQISWLLAAILIIVSFIYQTESLIFLLLFIGFLSLLLRYKVLMLSSFVCVIGICEHFQKQSKKVQIKNEITIAKNK